MYKSYFILFIFLFLYIYTKDCYDIDKLDDENIEEYVPKMQNFFIKDLKEAILELDIAILK